MAKKFEEIGTTSVIKKVEKVETINQSVRDYLNLSLGKRILHKDLKLYPYKMQLVQELKLQDASQRPHFVNQARLLEILPGKLISRRGDINWPPDLTRMEFFL